MLGEGSDACSFTSASLNDLFTYNPRDRGTETGEIFPEGEVKLDGETDEETDGESEDRRLMACLFNKGALKAVFNHDFAFNNTDLVTMTRLDREAREEAQELQRQLLESRREYLWG